VADELRLLHFADLHLGVQLGGRADPKTGLNRRIVDVCDRFDELCDVAEEQGVHAVLFAGDAFNNQHPNPTLQSLFASRVRRLARSGASVFLLIGNHDLPRTAVFAHPFSIYEALEVEGVVVGDRARVYRLPLRDDAPASELQVAALPHFSRHEVLTQFGADVDIDDAVARRVAKLGAEIDPAMPSVFVGHCHVNQADLGGAGDLFGVSEIQVLLSTLTSGQPFPYYALGHIHKQQVLSADPFVAYPGSLERVDFGEGDRIDVNRDGRVRQTRGEPKGFLRADLIRGEGSWTLTTPPVFHEVAARRFVTLDLGGITEDDPSADVTNRAQAARSAGVAFDDAIVRVKGVVTPSDRSRITHAVVREALAEAYDVRLALESSESPSASDPRFSEPMTEMEALDRFLEMRPDWSDDVDEIRRLGRELITETL
jgi:exonuclease SbcD